MDPELKTLILHTPIRYRRRTTSAVSGFPFAENDKPADGEERLAVYSEDSIVRMDPAEGPRVSDRLPPPEVLAEGVRGGETPPPPETVLSLERGVHGFLQGRASTEKELLSLLEEFARQAWWEGMDCRGPFIVRRVFEDGRWATQVWRRASKDSEER